MRIDFRWFIAGMLLGLAGLGVALLILLYTKGSLNLVPAPSPTPVPSPTATPLPSPTPRPTATPTPAASPTPTVPCYQAHVVESSAPPEDLQGGDPFEVHWVLENRGSCAWEAVAVQWEDEAPPEAQVILEPEPPIQPGERLTVKATITAPDKKGEYTLAWTLNVAETAVPVDDQEALRLTYQVTKDKVVMPPVVDQGAVVVRQNEYVDLDSDGQPEFRYNVPHPKDQSILHIGGRVRFLELWLPIHQAYYTCYYASYGTFNAIQDPASKIGRSYCYVTNSLRVGAFRIENVYQKDGVWYLVISFVTWKPKRPAP